MSIYFMLIYKSVEFKNNLMLYNTGAETEMFCSLLFLHAFEIITYILICVFLL